MEMLLTRNKFDVSGVFGELVDAAGVFQCVTLEHSFYEGGKFTTHIPPGKYKCTRFFSPHFGFEVWLINDVPGHDHMEIHKGNWNADSKGCVLVGEQVGHMNNGGFMLMTSGVALKALMEHTKDVDEWWLTVENVG